MKISAFCLTLILLICLAAPLLAEEAAPAARDIVTSCRLKLCQNSNDKAFLTDGKFKTFWRGGKGGWFEITAPKGQTIHGLYILWAEALTCPVLERLEEDGTWTQFMTLGEPRFYEEYIPLDGETHIRVRNPDPETQLCVTELHVLTEGTLPEWVHQWTAFGEKADIMVITAHPDDEVLYIGGVIPLYRGEMGKKLIQVNVTKQPASRKCELLECLWTMGVREYPVVSGDIFRDKYNRSLSETLSMWNKDNIRLFVTRLLRQYRPDVVVTHDLKGEYGHGAHKAVAWAMTECLSLAADEKYDPQSAAEYGVWQVKKLYIHLYGENRILMDWDQPLDAFGGKTAFEMACEGFKKHRTQQGGKYQVKESGPYDNRIFGLYYTAVGPDTPGVNDMFENIP